MNKNQIYLNIFDLILIHECKYYDYLNENLLFINLYFKLLKLLKKSQNIRNQNCLSKTNYINGSIYLYSVYIPLGKLNKLNRIIFR